MNKLVVVITLYQKRFSETPSAELLLTYALKNQIRLIIFDNSSSEDLKAPKQANISYQWHPENKGISAAYNFALSEGLRYEYDWLLLLDHDTKITADYLQFLISTEFNGVKAIVPQIISYSVVVSPLAADQYISLNSSQTVVSGLTRQPIMAINSGTTLSIAILKSIGGFNEEFPLDFLDHWLFWRLNQQSAAYLVSDEQIQHELSVQSPQTMTAHRYESILTAETKYYKKYNKAELSEYRKHLRLRLIKQFITLKNRKIWRMSYRNLKQLGKG